MLDVEKSKSKIEKIIHPTKKREKKFESGKEAIKRKKSRKETYNKRMSKFFADFRLARFARGVEQR